MWGARRLPDAGPGERGIFRAHSPPLAGPTTWSWVAQEFHYRGYHVAGPAPSGTAVVGGWRAAVIVGHNGAGRLLSVTLDRYIWLLGRIVGFIDCLLDRNLAHLLECLGQKLVRGDRRGGDLGA